MLNELKKILNENEQNNFDFPYNKEKDKSMPKENQPRKKVVTLKDINKLKRIRNQKREELAQDSVFAPILYSEPSQSGGDMTGGLGM